MPVRTTNWVVVFTLRGSTCVGFYLAKMGNPTIVGLLPTRLVLGLVRRVCTAHKNTSEAIDTNGIMSSSSNNTCGYVCPWSGEWNTRTKCGVISAYQLGFKISQTEHVWKKSRLHVDVNQVVWNSNIHGEQTTPPFAFLWILYDLSTYLCSECCAVYLYRPFVEARLRGRILY